MYHYDSCRSRQQNSFSREISVDVMADGSQVPSETTQQSTAHMLHTPLSAAAGRDRGVTLQPTGCNMICALLLLLLLLCVVSGLSRTKQRDTWYLVGVMDDGSQVPSKAARHSTAWICNTRMVLPTAAGRGSIVTW